MQELALIGAGGHASDVLGLIEHKNRLSEQFRVVGAFHSDPDTLPHRRFTDRSVPVLDLTRLEQVASEAAGLRFVAGVGYPDARRDIVAMCDQLGLEPAAIVHDDVSVGTFSSIGAGSIVLAMVSMSPYVSLGAHTYVSHGVLIGHDTEVGAYSSLMPGCVISGDCSIGEGVMVGSNATVLEKINIGAGVNIGAGSVVTGDVAPGTTVVGVPARPLS